MKQGRIKFRNKIIRCINEIWQAEFGAFVVAGENIFHKERIHHKSCHLSRLIIGTHKDGRAIFLYPDPRKRTRISIPPAEFMKKMAKRGAIVAVVYDLGDAWDALSGENRKIRTYAYEKTKEIESESDAVPPYPDDGLPQKNGRPMEES